MIGAFESEHFGHNSHPSGTVFPAALAIAEHENLSGRDFLTALTLGYELVCRVGAAQTNAVETERGIHNPAANGPFGAAAAGARLLGLNAELTAQALGIAGSHCGGLTEFAWDGAMTKRLHLGRAAQLGLESALLAQGGFTGPPTILEGRYGYFHAYSPAPKGELLLDGLGQRWLLEDLVVKAYPCHASSQALVAAIQDLKRTGVEGARVQRVHLRAGERLLEPRFLNAAPTTMLGAQYSIPYTMAIAFERDLDDPAAYDESVLRDPHIRRLAESVTWEQGDPQVFVDRRAELEVTIDGERRRVPAATFPGSADDPLTCEGATGKLDRFAGRVIDAAQRRQIVETVRRIEHLANVATLAARIRTADGERGQA
jgi:2-methylcitrate dehydratase PrpD